MEKQSAGILLYRQRQGELEVLLGHPGGPAWEARDLGAWTIPKGQIEPGEDPLQAALREFYEETGLTVVPPFLELGSIVQRSGKRVFVWASEGDADAASLYSNTFRFEWPRRSGKFIVIPEIDCFGWFGLREAGQKLNPAQVEICTRLKEIVYERQE